MATVTVFVGLDYSDAFVQVCVMGASGKVLGNRSCENKIDAIVDFVAPFVAHGGLEGGGRVRAAVEVGTGAANLAENLVRRGWSVDMAHAGFVSRMKNNPDKTDLQDAHLLADLVRVGYLPRVWLAPEAIRELRRLVRYRQELANQRRQTKQRIRGLFRDARQKPSEAVHPWTKSWWVWAEEFAQLGSESRWVLTQYRAQLKHLEECIATAEKRLHEVADDDPMVKRLLEQKGIGPVTAWTLRAEIGQFDRFRTGKQLARFCGLSPRNASSGPRQAESGLIKAANPTLRAVLIEAAHRLGRLEPRWVRFKQRLKARNKPGSVVAAAIANRWVRGLFHQMIEMPTLATPVQTPTTPETPTTPTAA